MCWARKPLAIGGTLVGQARSRQGVQVRDAEALAASTTTITVRLLDPATEVWRRLAVAASLSLAELHAAFHIDHDRHEFEMVEPIGRSHH